MNIGNKLYQARKNIGMSQEEVAEKLMLQDKQFQNGNKMKQYLI